MNIFPQEHFVYIPIELSESFCSLGFLKSCPIFFLGRGLNLGGKQFEYLFSILLQSAALFIQNVQKVPGALNNF